MSDRADCRAALDELAGVWPDRVRADLADLLDDPSTTLTVHTSGSTGTPQPITFSITQAVMSARATGEALGLAPGQRALLALDSEPIAGRMMLVRALALGLDLRVTAARSVPARPHEGEAADFTALVPRQLAELLAHAPYQLRRMGTLLIGGGPIPPEVESQLHDWPRPIYHSFAMTETLSHFALRRLGLGETYAALSGVTLAAGPEGELIVDCPWASERPLRTRDAVELLGPTEFRWLGRLDFVINSGGVKVHPEAVERHLALQLPGRTFVIVGQPDAEWGERPILVLEGGDPVDPAGLELPHPAWRPARAVVVPRLPRTRTGKINRCAVRAELAQELL